MSSPPTVVIVGLGAVGAMAAWQLSKRDDVRIIGIEQYGRVHQHGSYAGESRVFRTAYHEGGLYVPMLLESRELWRELEREAGRELYLEVGALSIAQADRIEMRTTLETIDEFDLPHRRYDTDELRAAFPQHRIHDGDIGVLDEYGGGIRSEVSVLSALRLAEERGAELRFNTRVLAIEEERGAVVVRTPGEAIRADRVIVASGSWSGRIHPDLDRLLRLQVLGLTWFMPDSIDAFLPDRFPAFLRDIGPVHFFGAPSLDGYSVKACSNPTWPVFRDVSEVPTAYTRDELVKIGQQAKEFFPALNPEPVRSSVHHCAYTPDRLPVVDLSDSGRLAVLAGLSGHGFKFAPVLGKWAAQLAVDGTRDGIDERFALASHLERLDALGPYTGGGH
ncbi:N-methyl-L-tryptophan oxidase [Pseudoclavibacter sp. AY1F1]|uniref:N-methyl-L-tryptophan oxidase n=1 Tax=Pseudoclavibacter sp. AY1F1 TaxID=2080583 RepID=UPI000CE8369D|nr:N-methyl-L-tryptophan oxidase [Pseudoclavibacter sp. AY1F1]PPF45459.1 N-methyl-L-tryptophan oxidase [Pseudoclavibacter sp. AY1F1]